MKKDFRKPTLNMKSFNEEFIIQASDTATYEKSRGNASQIYNEQVKPILHPKDGFVHVLMLRDFPSTMKEVPYGVRKKYTVELDEIVTSIQKDGYEIVDIKITADEHSDIYTLIMYK